MRKQRPPGEYLGKTFLYFMLLFVAIGVVSRGIEGWIRLWVIARIVLLGH